MKLPSTLSSLVLLFTVITQAARADLVAHYQFEGNGDDSVGTADGTPGTSVTFDAGVSGQAAVFGVSAVETTETINPTSRIRPAKRKNRPPGSA